VEFAADSRELCQHLLLVVPLVVAVVVGRSLPQLICHPMGTCFGWIKDWNWMTCCSDRNYCHLNNRPSFVWSLLL
jgi:hypothetical protein